MPYKDPEKRRKASREAQQRWRENNPERAKAVHANWCRANPERRKLQHREASFKKRYGMSLADRDRMLASQGGVCAACGAGDPGTKRGWHVDHCHGNGRVRGVLCHHCNVALGHAQDSIARLAALISYLEKHKKHDDNQLQRTADNRAVHAGTGIWSTDRRPRRKRKDDRLHRRANAPRVRTSTRS